MENVRKCAIEPKTLRECCVALIERAREIEQNRPVDAAFVAGYIARFLESNPDDPKRSA